MEHAAQKALKAMLQKQACQLIEQDMEVIIQGFEAALEAHGEDEDDGKRKFKFPIAIRQEISGGTDGQYDLDSKLSFSVRTKDEVHATVRTRPDLVDQMNRATGEPDKAEEFDLDVSLDGGKGEEGEGAISKWAEDVEKGNGKPSGAAQGAKKPRGKAKGRGAAAGH